MSETPQRYYKNTIWTNHALDRLKNRKIDQSLVYKTFANPDNSYKGTDGAMEYKKRFGIHTVTAVAKQNDNGEWIILSCWIDPPYKGTPDAYKKQRYYKYKNSNIFKKILMRINRKLFGLDF